MTKKYINKLAALTSGNMAELADSLPERDQLHADLMRLSAALDERFNLQTITCPVESL